jgi:hypothetical protein
MYGAVLTKEIIMNNIQLDMAYIEMCRVAKQILYYAVRISICAACIKYILN